MIFLPGGFIPARIRFSNADGSGLPGAIAHPLDPKILQDLEYLKSQSYTIDAPALDDKRKEP